MMIEGYWEPLLICWSLFAFAWWCIAVFLIQRKGARANRLTTVEVPVREAQFAYQLTVFKPLPGPLNNAERFHLTECITTFVEQLDENSELLVGCHVADEKFWQDYNAKMVLRYPAAKIKIVSHKSPQIYAANPKMSWMHILIPHANGDLWFWSDADIRAMPGTLKSLRDDFSTNTANMVTSPYIIDRVPSTPSMIDALFVNLEFYPGVLLLGRMDAIKFGFGSGMLFKASDFRAKVDLSYLGRCLADDFHLGRLLQPVRLGEVCLKTSSQERNWRGALSHYLRWQKTIRWNRPGGFASQLIVLPLLGWLTGIVLDPTSSFVWSGALAVLTMDILAVLLIFRLIGCPINIVRCLTVPIWSFARIATWLVCWLPLPVTWRGQKWYTAFQKGEAQVKNI